MLSFTLAFIKTFIFGDKCTSYEIVQKSINGAKTNEIAVKYEKST